MKSKDTFEIAATAISLSAMVVGSVALVDSHLGIYVDIFDNDPIISITSDLIGSCKLQIWGDVVPGRFSFGTGVDKGIFSGNCSNDVDDRIWFNTDLYRPEIPEIRLAPKRDRLST